MLSSVKEKNLLISFGDKISIGEYKLHSKFKNSVNFYNNDKLITLGNRFIGSGPTNIIFEEIFLENINRVVINKECFYINDKKYLISDEKVYSSTLSISNFLVKKFYLNLKIFEKILKILSNNRGLMPIIDENFEKKDNFMNNFILRIYEGTKILFKQSVIEGIKLIKGVGIGLTPSGDDFIYGLLTGLKVLEIVKNENNYPLRKIIYENAKGDNLISNNFLYHASEGLFFEKTKKLITSLFIGNENEIFDSSMSMLQIGETSGVDFSVGFLLTIKTGGLNGS
ncbi:MAG: oxamate carbamoyltransferase subunit AllH family protein [Caldisericia bacterium]